MNRFFDDLCIAVFLLVFGSAAPAMFLGVLAGLS